MKILFVVPLLLLAACSTSKPPKVAVRPQEPPVPITGQALRFPEATRAYHVGRYADPNNDLILHEQHVVYRVEARTRWNLHPGPGDMATTMVTIPQHDVAYAALPVNDAILAEVNAQKAATTAVIGQARQLSGALEQFQTALSQAKSNLRETAALRDALNRLEKRLSSVEAGQQMATPISNTMSNAIPAPDP